MIYMGCYEPLNTHRFRTILKRGMVAVDVGANIGYFTLLAASLVGVSGRVFAVEPWPANLALLRRFVEANYLSQVSVFGFGLGSSEGSGRVSQADQNVFNNRTATMAGEPGTGIAVPVRTLDSCVREWNLNQIDLLKIDVDGFETRVLHGAKETLERGIVKNIIIELDEFWLARAQSSPAAVASDLGRAGFRDLSRRQWLSSLLLGPGGRDHHFRFRL
jgi:FkbM family methyltransferase